MGTPLIEQVRAALEVVRANRGKKIVRFCGRSATHEYQVESIAYDLGISPEDWSLIASGDLIAGLLQTPEAEVASEITSHETTIVLTPGSVVFRPDGDLPILVEGESAPVWCVPGDFELFLEPGIDDLEGKVRELLVGTWREPAEGDSERLSGIFLTPDRLDAYRQHIELLTRDLAKQIGFDPDESQSDDQLPRGESWLAERADSDAKLTEANTKLTEANTKLATLEAEIAAAQERIKELEVKPEPAPGPELTIEPEQPSSEPKLPSSEPVVVEGSTPSKTRGK